MVWYGAAVASANGRSTSFSRKRSKTIIAAVNCPVFGAFGEGDHIISLDDVRRFRNCLEENKKSYDIHIYRGAPHGWLNDTMPGRYRKTEAEAGWAAQQRFLARSVRRRMERCRALAVRERQQRELRLLQERADGVALGR